jgi:tRNA modification GTPase
MFDMKTVNFEQLLSLINEIKNQNPNLIPVANKMDSSSDDAIQKIKEVLPETIFISAQFHKGIELLKEKLFSMAAGNEVLSENVIVTNARHYSALKEISASLEEIKKGIENKMSGDLLSLDIRRCLHYLGEITGEISNEDMLDYIFSKFCIGK